MAKEIKNARLALTTAYQTVYAVPAGKSALVNLAQVANVDGVNAVDISSQWLDASAANAPTRLTHTVPLAADDSLSLISGPLALEEGDTIQAMASANGDAELTLSIVEFF